MDMNIRREVLRRSVSGSAIPYDFDEKLKMQTIYLSDRCYTLYWQQFCLIRRLSDIDMLRLFYLLAK